MAFQERAGFLGLLRFSDEHEGCLDRSFKGVARYYNAFQGVLDDFLLIK